MYWQVRTVILSILRLMRRIQFAGFGSVTGIGSAMTGGTSKIVSIVTAADVQATKEKLVAESTDAVRNELKGKFADSVQIIDTSFVADERDATSVPAVGAEAPDKKAKLTSKSNISSERY